MIIILIIYAVLMTILFICSVAACRDYGKAMYREGQEIARYTNLMPHEKVIGVFCADGVLYVYDAKMRKYIRKASNAAEMLREVYELGKDNGLDFEWKN